MQIKIRFFKPSGKVYTEYSITPDNLQAWDDDKIQQLIENRYYHPSMDYMYEAVNEEQNLYNCRLVKR